MPPTPSSAVPSWPARVLTPFFEYLGATALVIALSLSVIHLPSPPGEGLDPSWRMAIGHAAEHQWQFGRDIVFTYGPLGYLLASTNSGGLYVQHLVWQVGFSLLFALGIWAFGRSFTGWRKGVYYVYFFAFGVAYHDAVHMIAILFLGFALLRDALVARRWFVVLLTAGLAVMAMIKFTNLMLAGVSVASAVGLQSWRRRWLNAALIGGSFVAAFLALWVWLGQAIGNLPAYVINSLSVSSGYVEAMGLDESGTMFAIGVAAGLTFIGYLIFTVVGAADRPRAVAVAVLAAAAGFLNWKHGFVRADGHVLAHFFICLFFVCSAPILLQEENTHPVAKGFLRFACGACSVIGICLNSPSTLLYAPSIVNSRTLENATYLRAIDTLPQMARSQFAEAQKRFVLPASKAVISSAPVDVFGIEQAYAIVNGLNYRPRPALQSYAAYNEHLGRLDEEFMASARAPDYVLQKISGSTIDNRLPSFDDSLATRYLYYHYSFLMEERDFLIWRRQPIDPALDHRDLLSAQTVSFGQVVTAPDLGDVPVWCEVAVSPSWLGRLRTFFYKPPAIRISVTDGGGSTGLYRLVRGQGENGFFAYPHFTSNSNVVKFQEGGPAPRIASLSVEMPASDRKYFRSKVGFRFYRLPLMKRSLNKASDRPDEVRFRLFNRIPSRVSTPYPAEVMVENGKDVMLTHPPSALEFSLGAGPHHLAGKYGFVSRAYTEGNTTDGAEFVIEWVDQFDHTQTVFHRLLRPLDTSADRGEQSFDVALPAGPGRVIMRTTPGPANNIAFDWTYWTDVKFSE